MKPDTAKTAPGPSGKRKRGLAFGAAAAVLLTAGGFGAYLWGQRPDTGGAAPEFAPDSRVEVLGADQSVVLSEEDAEKILEILENGRWTDDLSACALDYSLVISDVTLTYHCECGTFNDSRNHRSLSVGEDIRKEVNGILGRYLALEG